MNSIIRKLKQYQKQVSCGLSLQCVIRKSETMWFPAGGKTYVINTPSNTIETTIIISFIAHLSHLDSRQIYTTQVKTIDRMGHMDEAIGIRAIKPTSNLKTGLKKSLSLNIIH